MEREQTVISTHETEQGTLAMYVSGFVLSIVLTLAAYVSTVKHQLPMRNLIALLIGLALVQFFVQLFFFLHLGKETKPRWKLLVLCLMIGVVLILVVGSLWIMYNLNYRMTPQQINTYMQNQDGGV